MEDIGSGIAVLAFWGFIAAVSVAGIWDGVRKREAEQETIRRIIESSKEIDEQMLNRIIAVTKGDTRNLHNDLRATSLWIMPVALALTPFAWFLGRVSVDAQNVMFGVAALLAVLSGGFWFAAKVVRSWDTNDK